MQLMHFGNASSDVLAAVNGKLLQDTTCMPPKNSSSCYDQEWYVQDSSSKGRLLSPSVQPHCALFSRNAGAEKCLGHSRQE